MALLASAFSSMKQNYARKFHSMSFEVQQLMKLFLFHFISKVEKEAETDGQGSAASKDDTA